MYPFALVALKWLLRLPGRIVVSCVPRECEKSFTSCLKQNIAGRTLNLCMAACGHSADDQLRLAFEEFPDAFYLLAELAALRGGQVVEWLHGDGEFSARAAQVPDPGNRPVDEQHREVSGLATGGQRAFGSSAGEEQLAWLAADRVGIEVGQQPDALGCRGQHRGVPGREPCERS